MFHSSINIWVSCENERMNIGIGTCKDPLLVLKYGSCGVENCLVV
jgi:hypothetical protein